MPKVPTYGPGSPDTQHRNVGCHLCLSLLKSRGPLVSLRGGWGGGIIRGEVRGQQCTGRAHAPAYLCSILGTLWELRRVPFGSVRMGDRGRSLFISSSSPLDQGYFPGGWCSSPLGCRNKSPKATWGQRAPGRGTRTTHPSPAVPTWNWPPQPPLGEETKLRGLEADIL